MDLKANLYLDRAENEIVLAKCNFEISKDIGLKKILKIPEDKTFFNDVISQCYYSIFYAAKAYLLTKGIITAPPEEHKKTYIQFKKIAISGELDNQLLEIYEKEAEKAITLLGIFRWEKRKRGRFTYNVNSNANLPYAEESIKNAIKFASIIKAIVEKIKLKS